MLRLDHWQEVFQSLWRHKLRTVLTAFGVFWGILMLVLLLATGKGLERGVLQSFKDEAINSVWIRGRRTSLPYTGLNPGRSIGLTIDDLHAIRENITGIENVTPRKWLPGYYLVSHQHNIGTFELLGIYPAYAVAEQIILLEGRLVNWLDVQQQRKIVVIGEHVVDVLFPNQTRPVGQYIDINGIRFQVVGTFTDSGNEGERRRIYLPYSTIEQVFDLSRYVDDIIFTTQPGYSWQRLQSPVRHYLAKRHQFDPKDRVAITAHTREEQYREYQSLFLGINIFVSLVGIGTLFAGVVGISNIMLVTVQERTREIGIRKALGATPWSILTLVVQEALVITATAGYAGLVAGCIVVEAARRLNLQTTFFRDPQVDLVVAVAATMILIVSGLLAGVLPALRAVNIKPIEALRHE